MAVAEPLTAMLDSAPETEPWPYIPELLEQPVPRFTSYPPATHFQDGVGDEQYRSALEAIAPGTPISLYLHIPYCNKICYYCGCNTGAANRKTRLDAYLGALEKEIELVGGILGGRAKVKHIAFGGGSPNAIEPVQFVRLVDRLSTIFSAANPEISVELDPRNFSLEWALALSACNVRRVSLGVQTFAPHVQRAIGRIQPFAMIEECVASLKMRGISTINFDLMYGLPQQSLADLEETVETAIGLHPSRAALFGYAHLPDMIPRQRKIDSSLLPDTRLRFEQAQAGFRLFTAAGYEAVGFDHFALPEDALNIAHKNGHMRRNFQGFTDDDCNILLGFGASAISQFPGLIVQNEKHAARYRSLASAGKPAAAKCIEKPEQSRRIGAIIERLLCDHQAVLPAIFRSRLSAAPLNKLIRQRLVSWDGKRLAIPDHGRHYSRQIAAALTELLKDAPTGDDRTLLPG